MNVNKYCSVERDGVTRWPEMTWPILHRLYGPLGNPTRGN